MEQISEKLNISILDRVLRGDASSMLMVSPMVLTYVETILNKEAKLAARLYLLNNIEEMMAMLAKSVKLAQKTIPDLFQLLCNIEPNT